MIQLTIMLMVPDRARADMILKEDRIYYRFVTESSEDEGELPGLKERFLVVTERLLQHLKPLPGEKPVDTSEIKVSVFADNVLKPTADLSEQALRRMVDELLRIDDSLAFLQGFV